MSSLAANDTSQEETKTAASTTTEEETKTKTTPVSFYTNLLSRPEHIPLSVFADSVRLSKEGIKRNKYNHHKGNAATRPPCLHGRCENWKFDLCADCGADLGPERLAKEQKRERKNIAKDHLPLLDFIAASESNLRVTHATLGQGKLRELRGTSAAIVFDCDPSAPVVLPCSDVEEFRTHLEVHHATQSHRRGIRLDALLAFAHDHDCMEWPVWMVVRDIILSATRGTMCRYADLPELQGMFGETTVFMSHCWGGTFGDLVGAACHGARRDRVVWIDIFAVKQWPGNVCDLNFRGVIERSEAMVVSTSPVDGLSERFLRNAERAAFLTTEQGEAAKKIMPFCRLWCVVEVAAGVAKNKNIVVKCGQVIRREDGMLEYVTGEDGVNTMANLSHMIDVVSSECAVQADYVREMGIIRETEGGVENVNTVVAGVVRGAMTSIDNNVLEIDAAACGEFESLLNLKMSSLSEGEERKRAGKMLFAACSGGRVEIVRVLLDKWLAEEEVEEVMVVVVVAEEKGETKGEERREEERGGERRRREREEWLCRLVDEEGVVILAAEGGHLEVVEMLLERVQGADVNVSTKSDGRTALYQACQNGHGEVVRLLLALSEINVNQADTDEGRTPLFKACSNGHTHVVKLLLASSGIDVNQHNKKNETPLNMASYMGHVEVVRLLCQQPNIDLNKKDKWNDSPLGGARKKNHTEVVQLLVDAGAQ